MHLFLMQTLCLTLYQTATVTNLAGQVSMPKARPKASHDQSLLWTVVLSHLPYLLSIVLHVCVHENPVLASVVNARCCSIVCGRFAYRLWWLPIVIPQVLSCLLGLIQDILPQAMEACKVLCDLLCGCVYCLPMTLSQPYASVEFGTLPLSSPLCHVCNNTVCTVGNTFFHSSLWLYKGISCYSFSAVHGSLTGLF